MIPTSPCARWGAPHPHKIEAQRLLKRVIVGRERLITDAEVHQEILHCYVAIDRRDAIQPAFDALLRIVDEVFPIELVHVERAKAIVYGQPALSACPERSRRARDAIHLAIMESAGVDRIMSFDAGFDGYPGITRLGG